VETCHPVVEKIVRSLEQAQAWFERFEHGEVRTSEEAAAVRQDYIISQGSKALIVRLKKAGEKQFVMLVVPGDRRFDPTKARSVLGVSDLRFAREDEVSDLTGGIKPGGIPPWGNLFGLKVYADTHVFDNEKIVFNAGDRRVSIGMYATDYKKLVDPIVVDLT
jgi:Ala-tRNA(Pro) deacylase